MLRKTIFLLLFIFSNLLKAQSETISVSPAFISIIVEDLKTSKRWYREMFNHEIGTEFSSEERDFKICNLKGKDFQLELIEMDQALSR